YSFLDRHVRAGGHTARGCGKDSRGCPCGCERSGYGQEAERGGYRGRRFDPGRVRCLLARPAGGICQDRQGCQYQGGALMIDATIEATRVARAAMSEAEWEARTDLAAAHRLVDLYGWSNLIYNHVTLRVPGEPDWFLVKPHQLMFHEVCASNLLKLRLDGSPSAESENVNAA